MRSAPFLFRLLREEGLSVIAITRVMVRFFGLTLEDAKRATLGQDVQNEQSWHVQPPRFGSLEGLEEFRKSLTTRQLVDVRIRDGDRVFWTDGDWIKCLRNPKHCFHLRSHFWICRTMGIGPECSMCKYTKECCDCGKKLE